jgi:hypothetical protein
MENVMNLPVIQGKNFQFLKEEISHDQYLVVTDFLFEELKICTLYIHTNWDVQHQTCLLLLIMQPKAHSV